MHEAARKLTQMLPSLILGLWANTATATDRTDIKDSNWYLGAAVSALWSHVPSLLTVNNGAIAPYHKDVYTLKTNTNKSVAANLGHQWRHARFWLPSYALGVHYERFFLGKTQGSVTQYSLPQFLNYSYSWDNRADLFSLYSQIALLRYEQLSPFLTVGLGVAVNHAGAVEEIALSGVTPRVAPGFARHTQNNAAYTVGVGLSYDILAQCSVAVAYNYQYLGALRSSNGATTWAAEYLTIKNYQMNMLTVALAYHF